MTIHPGREIEINTFLAKEVTISAKYSDFANIFLKKSANFILKQTRANNHAIKLENGKKLPYRPIYSLEPIKFKTVKTNIKINLTNGFIRASKLPAGALIPFVCEPNSSFYLYINYQRLNNLIIKNRYTFPLIGKSLDWLGQAKQFT